MIVYVIIVKSSVKSSVAFLFYRRVLVMLYYFVQRILFAHGGLMHSPINHVLFLLQNRAFPTGHVVTSMRLFELVRNMGAMTSEV